jgi:hypothetical protein
MEVVDHLVPMVSALLQTLVKPDKQPVVENDSPGAEISLFLLNLCSAPQAPIKLARPHELRQGCAPKCGFGR